MRNRVFRGMFGYLKKYIFLLVVSLLSATASVIIMLYIPRQVGDTIDLMLGAGNTDINKITSVLFIIATESLIVALLQWLMTTINNHVAYSTVRDIRRDCFNVLQKLPLGYYDTHRTGDILNRAVNDSEQFADGLVLGFSGLFSGFVTVICTFIFMFSINIGITAVVVVVTPLSLFIASFIAKRSYSMFTMQSQIKSEQTSFIDEAVANKKTTAAFSYEEESIHKFDEINRRLEKVSFKAAFFSSLTNPSTRFVNNLVYTGVIITGALFVVKGTVTVGELTCFLSYASQFAKPFNEISGIITEMQNALACIKRVFELMDEKTQTPDKQDAFIDDTPEGNIKFDDVYFSYLPDKPLLQNINLNISKGTKIAIVGPTGCGKTTLINLLMRFYDVDKGEILMDYVSYKNISRQRIRKNFGMVLQNTWLAEGTIAENIAYGKPEATPDEIITAARSAHADGFIRRLEKGFDTVIGEDGGNLSQGEKQLICIARVMLCLPPMLILDEATSSIDTMTELRIQDAFSKMTEGRTSFIVAHRLSTVMDADMILVMKDGNIIETGTHTDLMKSNGFYANIFNSQFKTE